MDDEDGFVLVDKDDINEQIEKRKKELKEKKHLKI